MSTYRDLLHKHRPHALSDLLIERALKQQQQQPRHEISGEPRTDYCNEDVCTHGDRCG